MMPAECNFILDHRGCERAALRSTVQTLAIATSVDHDSCNLIHEATETPELTGPI